MNKKQRKKARKMKSLMRLAKRNSSDKNVTESGLNSTEAKYLQKTQQQLLNEKPTTISEKEIASTGSKTDRSSCGKQIALGGQQLSTDFKLDIDFINKKLPKELIIRIFSYLDINSLCRCACVSKYWNTLALDGSNWQYVDFFNFQTDISSNVVENLASRCREFLKAIRLENCRWVTDDSIKTLFKSCVNIEILNLKHCVKLTDYAFAGLQGSLIKVTNINLESCLIGDRTILAISKGCPNLESIDISWCKNVTNHALEELVVSCTNLKYFSSRGLTTMNNSVLTKISINCINLTHLNINNCSNVSDDGLISVANGCTLLKFLGVSNCSYISNDTLKALGTSCKDLTILEASYCINLSDTGFAEISKGCSKLERLDLEECNRITDQTINNIAANCSKLRHLTLSRCELITDEAISKLSLSNCAMINETLQVLELDNCPLISDTSLKHLYACKSLLHLELYDCQLISRSGIHKFQKALPNCKVHAYFAPPIPASSQRPTRSCSCKCCTIL